MKSKKAFTLIELLLVIALIAFIFALSSKIFVKKRTRVKNVFNEWIQLNSRLARSSKLHDRVYRLAIQLNLEERDQYWVEKKSSLKNPEKDNPPEEISEFERDTSFYEEPKPLMSLLDIAKVEQKDKTYDEGLVYIYYYPSSLAQETKIYFLRPDKPKAEWILHLEPVSKELKLIK